MVRVLITKILQNHLIAIKSMYRAYDNLLEKLIRVFVPTVEDGDKHMNVQIIYKNIGLALKDSVVVTFIIGLLTAK